MGTFVSNISLSRKSHVISLCPGWFPKVEMALYYLNFQGHVTMD